MMRMLCLKGGNDDDNNNNNKIQVAFHIENIFS